MSRIGAAQPKIKVVFIGDAGVGKTFFANTAADATFGSLPDDTPTRKLDNSPSTIGIDFFAAKRVIDEERLDYQFWDTAGQEGFRSMIGAYLRDAHIAVLCFDLTSRKSFESLFSTSPRSWFDILQLDQVAIPKRPKLFLLGLKADQLVENGGTRERAVERQDAVMRAKSLAEADYFETDVARIGVTITFAFFCLTSLMPTIALGTQRLPNVDRDGSAGTRIYQTHEGALSASTDNAGTVDRGRWSKADQTSAKETVHAPINRRVAHTGDLILRHATTTSHLYIETMHDLLHCASEYSQNQDRMTTSTPNSISYTFDFTSPFVVCEMFRLLQSISARWTERWHGFFPCAFEIESAPRQCLACRLSDQQSAIAGFVPILIFSVFMPILVICTQITVERPAMTNIAILFGGSLAFAATWLVFAAMMFCRTVLAIILLVGYCFAALLRRMLYGPSERTLTEYLAITFHDKHSLQAKQIATAPCA